MMRDQSGVSRQWRSGLLLLILCALVACGQTHEDALPDPPIFELLNAQETGLHFANTLKSTKDFNVFHYMYFYNGGGVAVGDFNNDSLIDIYFTANMESNRLFLNQGGMNFSDVTEAAGVSGMPGWTTGVCAVDINQDGLLDLYVSQLGDFREIHGRNQLYVCQGINDDGIPEFTEEAGAYGLDLVGFGTQACFFDYDLDGDLDMFQLNHSVHNNGTFGQRSTFIGTFHETSGDRMFRNDDGKFVEVTSASGIQSSVIGYGLGVACSDINLDGWPDLYVCNDFHENDYLYLNQHDGTFREALTEEIMHTSRFAMGVDIADINNDGYSEIMTLDMHPFDPHILKSSLGEDGYGTFLFKIGYGYNYQYARNTLQLNNGNETFSEIGIMANVYATDWSWAALFLDFDQDGLKDLFISNGIPKRMNDIDYVNFMSNDEVQWRIKTDNMEETDLALEDKLPEIRVPNKFYHNAGNLSFEELHMPHDQPAFSNGAAYGDFDNDGDLDLVVNNIGEAPYLYQNLTIEHGTGHHDFIALRLQGPPGNINAIGARVIAYVGEKRLVDENFPVTGYQSSVQPGIHLGVGDLNAIDSIHLVWPDGTYQRVLEHQCNRVAYLAWAPGLPRYDFALAATRPKPRIATRDVTGQTGLAFTHQDNDFIEFDREALIPHMTSTAGPALAVADVNGDGMEDVFVGSAKWEHSALFVQTSPGQFTREQQTAFAQDSVFEDVDAVFADVDGDGDADLVVASGGNEFRDQAEALKQRLYVNDGRGRFTRDHQAFQEMYMTAACVEARDFDQDGDVDLFLGGRAVPWNYGVIPNSYLLENDGKGHFTDVTKHIAAELGRCGMVRDAKWADVNQDGRPDLLVAVEWGPVQIFENTGGSFRQVSLEGTDGLWNFIEVADFDGDGDMDFVAGNLGLNSKLRASREKPVRMYVNDFDDNDKIDQIVTYYLGDRELPFATYAEIMSQMPSIKKKYLYARDFADASLADLVGEQQVRSAQCFSAYVMENSWFENTGDLQFSRHALPRRMQFAPLEAAAMRDFDGDGMIDLLAMGNFYESNIEMGRYDADYGNILFNAKSGLETGELQTLKISGQVRKISTVKAGDRELIVIARNNASVVVLEADHDKPDL